MSFLNQFAEARREVRKTAKTMPQLFPQWQAWQQAERELAEAQARRDAAKAAWDRVLKGEQR